MTIRSLVLAATLAVLIGYSAVAHAHGSSSPSGKCAKVKCVASDACHLAGTCDPATGACSNPVAPDGGSCSDGNACTEKDVCRAGLCVGKVKKNGSSCDDHNGCTEKDVCQAGTCGGKPVKNGTSCSDGNGCTEKDACQAGACTGKLKKNGSSCDDKNPCTSKDVCTAGACAGTNKRDGSECELDDDDNECISEDGTCRAGVCNPDKQKTCAAPDQCHVGLCDPKTGGCFSRDAASGTACDDGNKCTSPDQCANGVCTGTPGCDDDNRCTIDSCDATLGCVHTQIICDDKDACTVDACDPQDGCFYTVVNCDDSNACTDEFCDRTSGCAHVPIICDDDDPCTVESCDAEVGCLYELKDCDDGDACTDDSCNSAGECVHAVVDCDDNNACTGDECVPGRGCVNTYHCFTKDRCVTEGCDPASGCFVRPIECDDHNPCTQETCDPSGGCRARARSCDDGNACTNDACDPQTGCFHTTVTCDDNNPCTVDTCDDSTGCAHAAVADGTKCDDGDACTPVDTCQGGACRKCPLPGFCDNGVPCDDEEGFCISTVCAFDQDCGTGETCVVNTPPSPRFVDNGDGTVTDRQTCLMWEQKTSAVNNFTNPSDLHDPDNQYQWSSSGTAPDGSLFTGFLTGLNTGTGLAGHIDWRLPTSGGTSSSPSGERRELESILDLSANGCGTGSPCISATFGPTWAGSYWSLSSPTPTTAWMVSFGNGNVALNNKGNSVFVRAVRGGVVEPCGNGVVCGTEQCDPPGGQGCGQGQECTATCQCLK